MKSLLNISFLITLFFSCSSEKNQSEIISEKKLSVEKRDLIYQHIIDKYLETIEITPDLTINNIDTSYYNILGNYIEWKQLERGLQIKINNEIINTSKAITTAVRQSDIDSVNFVNNISQIKFYKKENIICFKLSFYPCTGMGCSVIYTLIYDIDNRKISYFGGYGSGFESNLYHIKNQEKTYYISRFYSGRSASLIDTTEYVLFIKNNSGDFSEERDSLNNYYFFTYISRMNGNVFSDTLIINNWFEDIEKQVLY